MTYTLVFRVSAKVWDALQHGELKRFYTRVTPHTDQQCGKAQDSLDRGKGAEAIFIDQGEQLNFKVMGLGLIDSVEWEGELVWAVELGERIA